MQIRMRIVIKEGIVNEIGICIETFDWEQDGYRDEDWNGDLDEDRDGDQDLD